VILFNSIIFLFLYIVSQEVTSLCSQLAYTYSVNRRASYPFTLFYTSLNGRTFTRLEGMSDAGYKRWANTEWWQEGYERLWLGQRGATQDDRETGESKNQQESGNVDESKPEDEPKESQGIEIESGAGETENDIQKNVVYLTADSEEELTELKEDEIYIIGGICDHNRYKVKVPYSKPCRRDLLLA